MNKVNDADFELLMNKNSFLTTNQLAKLFGYKSTDALRKQRSKGNRPIFPYTKIGNRIFYSLSEILKLAQQNLVRAD